MTGESDTDRRIDAAAGVLGEMAERDVALAPLTTYRVGGPAALLARPRSIDDLLLAGRVARERGLPVLVIGRGSNLLVADAGFDGIVVSLTEMADDVTIDGVEVAAGGAVRLPVLARRTVAAGLTGFEWAVGVPGSVGGAVRMNAGGHGSDMAAVVRSVRVVDLRTGQDVSMPAAACEFSYRHSSIRPHQVVVEATLELREAHDGLATDDGEIAADIE